MGIPTPEPQSIQPTLSQAYDAYQELMTIEACRFFDEDDPDRERCLQIIGDYLTLSYVKTYY